MARHGYKGMHVRICIALLTFLLVSMASAFADPIAVSAGQTPPHESLPKLLLPNCDSYRPNVNTAAQIDVNSSLHFELDAEGTLRNGKITPDGGDDALDAAALVCAENSGVKFNMQNGPVTPAIVPVLVRWARDGHSSLIVGCPFQFASIRLNEQGDVGLILHVSKDGAVSSAVVAKSSGFKRVDDSALACVFTFRYEPMMRNGAPVELDRQLNLTLRNR
jgi:TonB family protein